MSNDEVKIISLIKKILNKFMEMKIKFKHESQARLVVIYNTMKKCLNDCFDCLIYPNNRFADLSLRIFMENLIIISFLLQNDKRFSDNWFYWSMVSKKYIKPDCFDFMVEFTTWREKAMADIAIMYGAEKIPKIFCRQYGWMFYAKCDFNKMNLKTISELADCELAYDCFEFLSQCVHSNTVYARYDIRFENNTFDIVRGMLDAITLVLLYLKPCYLKSEIKSIAKQISKARDFENFYHEEYTAEIKKYVDKMIENYKNNLSK